MDVFTQLEKHSVAYGQKENNDSGVLCLLIDLFTVDG